MSILQRKFQMNMPQKSGRAIVAHNKSNIPENKLNKLLEIISDNFYLICTKWCDKFGKETLHFYC